MNNYFIVGVLSGMILMCACGLVWQAWVAFNPATELGVE